MSTSPPRQGTPSPDHSLADQGHENLRSGGLGRALASAWDSEALGSRTALVDAGGYVTYGQLASEVRRRVQVLLSTGMTGGQIVAVVAEKNISTVAWFFAAIAAGAVPVFMDPREPDDDIVSRLRRVHCRYVVVGDPGRAASLSRLGGVLTDADLSGTHECELPALELHDHAMLLFTSGSTGEPKGIVLTHANLLVNARGVIQRTAIDPDHVLLHVMPLHHTNGVNNQLIAPLLAGAQVILRPRFSAADAVAALEDEGPTYMTGVPTMYLRMLEHVRERGQFPTLRFLRCGSAPITTAQQRQIEDAFGVPLILSYGMSEATCTSTMNPIDRPRPGTVGTVLDGQSVRVVLPGTLDDVPDGDEGEIVIGGSAIMAGYLTGTALHDATDNGWLRTGDLGKLDDEGYLTVSGRLKDTIIRGGENIVPATVERALIAHEAVRDCCVVPRPHPELGEVPVAFVSTTVPPPDPDDLREWAARHLPRHSVPDAVIIVTDLPINGVGKHDRTALRRSAALRQQPETS